MGSDKSPSDILKNTQMEETLLKNSKGANYMSFILDIEIVIKKEEEVLNLPKSIVKSKVRENTEKVKDQSGRRSTVASNKQDEVTAFLMEAEPTSLFHHAQNKIYEQDLTQDLSNKQPKEDKNSDTKVHSEIPGKKRRKSSRIDKKAKIFKGKVEKIDFLECNRIFMCNYVKSPKYTMSCTDLKSLHAQYSYRKSKTTSRLRTASSALIKNQNALLDQNKNIGCLGVSNPTAPSRKSRFGRIDKMEFDSSPHADNAKWSQNSAGDSNLTWSYFENEKYNKTCTNQSAELGCRNFPDNYNLQIQSKLLKEPEMKTLNACTINRDLFCKNKKMAQKHTEKHCCSEQRLICHKQERSKSTEKIQSLPSMYFNGQMIVPNEKHFMKTDSAENNNDSQKGICEKEAVEASEEICNGLSDLHFQIFNETKEFIVPQVNIINGYAQVELFSEVSVVRDGNICIEVSKLNQNEELNNIKRKISSMTNNIMCDNLPYLSEPFALKEKQSYRAKRALKEKCDDNNFKKGKKSIWNLFRQCIMCK